MVRVGSNHEKFRNYFRASISQKKDLYNFRHLRSRWGKNRWSESEAVSSTVEATHVRKNTASASALLDLLWIKHDKVPSSWPFRWTKSGEEPSRHYKCITTPPQHTGGALFIFHPCPSNIQSPPLVSIKQLHTVYSLTVKRNLNAQSCV